ncbi:glycosyltransferase family 2 protein [Candidatus Gottesmanbacteria bacterium]|nr:glycosyltransferase family 2 protein [Candidatus Gottesmanbacteria bacterium]
MKKHPPNTISAVIIAKNEEVRIHECLSSLKWADEIIVVDNNSTDRTTEIARTFGATVISSNATDFSVLRTQGLQAAKGVWILYVDADEVVTKELELEILDLLQGWSRAVDSTCYFISRKNYYFGVQRPVGDKMQRLFYKPAFVRWSGSLHETAIVYGSYGSLRHELHHDTHRNLEEMVAKTNTWSDEEARLRLISGHPTIAPWRFLRVFVTGFIRSHIKEFGWMAGTHGWIESMYQGFSMVMTYIKLWELQKKS